jgi:Na+-transporting methylmalonyl-CoA/oxaloacetate decarboxylase gamma subunit
MSVLDSLLVDGFGISIVFAILIIICFLIKLISIVFSKKHADENAGYENRDEAALPAGTETQYQDEELLLKDVDEKTAALIMAIVSRNANIPLSRLQFTSIKLVK